MDCTTAEVVCSPTDCALPVTLNPSWQPMTAIKKGKDRGLGHTQHKVPQINILIEDIDEHGG